MEATSISNHTCAQATQETQTCRAGRTRNENHSPAASRARRVNMPMHVMMMAIVLIFGDIDTFFPSSKSVVRADQPVHCKCPFLSSPV